MSDRAITDALDIRQTDGIAIISLAGTDQVIGEVRALPGTWDWEATAFDGTVLTRCDGRLAAAHEVHRYWLRNDGPTVSPTSTVALARELHRRRAHPSPVRRQVNWLCSCNEDAVAFNNTKWLRNVVETLGGTFPTTRSGQATTGG